MLLAAMAPDDLDRLLEGLPLPAYTAKTITSERALRRELAAVRRQGIAYDDCELDDDVRCIALPVRDFAGRCVGAIGIRSEERRVGKECASTGSTRGPAYPDTTTKHTAKQLQHEKKQH